VGIEELEEAPFLGQQSAEHAGEPVGEIGASI